MYIYIIFLCAYLIYAIIQTSGIRAGLIENIVKIVTS